MTQQNLKASASCHDTEPKSFEKKIITRTSSTLLATQHDPQLLNPKLQFHLLVRPLLLIWLECTTTAKVEILPDGYLTMHACHVQAAAKEQGQQGTWYNDPGLYQVTQMPSKT